MYIKDLGKLRYSLLEFKTTYFTVAPLELSCKALALDNLRFQFMLLLNFAMPLDTLFACYIV